MAFTGHRPDKLNPFILRWAQTGIDPLEEILKQLSPKRVISGMAPGIDVLGLRAARKLGIPVTAAVPWPGHGAQGGWRGRTHLYLDLLDECDVVEVLGEDTEYRPWYYQKRNEWMVDNCDALVAVWDGSDGGTKNCVLYARKVGRPIWYYNWNDGSWIYEHLPV